MKAEDKRQKRLKRKQDAAAGIVPETPHGDELGDAAETNDETNDVTDSKPAE